MKTTTFFYLLIAILLSGNNSLMPQQRFKQVYTSFSEAGAGAVVHEDADGFTLCGYALSKNNSPTGFFIQKVDQQGRSLWVKEFKEEGIYFSGRNQLVNIAQDGDSGFIIAGGDSTSNGRVKIIRLSYTGEILLNKSLNVNTDTYSVYVMVSRDSSVYLSLKNSSDSLHLIKTDPRGDIVWENNYSLASTSYFGIMVEEFSDETLLLAGNKKLIWIDKDGSILNEKETIPDYIYRAAILQNDDIIISTTSKKLQRFSKNGEMLWTQDEGYYFDAITETRDGSLITIPSFHGYNVKVDKYSSNGINLWEKILNTNTGSHFDLQFIRETKDNGYLLTGYYMYTPTMDFSNVHYFPVIVKTDSAAEYGPSLSLIFPFKDVNASNQYEIEWLSDQVNNIDISYSADNGLTWKEISNNVTAHYGYSAWVVPFNISDNCLLRISDSENPGIADISDSEFAILPVFMQYEYIAANEVKMWIGNSGDSSHDPFTNGKGFFWPGGENATMGAVFQDGLVWGGKVNGQVRVGGNTYRRGLLPGNILPDGTRADSGDYQFQVWKLKKDWQSVQNEIEKSRYLYNYNNWPVITGAPWVDVNRDGEYTAGIDHTLYYGDETLFYVTNDLDTNTARYLYGSDPLGLEVQCLLFAKDTTTALKDAVFKKYKLINKSGHTITDMYLAYWTDDDLGDPNDDYVGVDTALNLGYTWNGKEDDQSYGTPPPAVGHMIIQGPIIPASSTDSARFGENWKKGYKNLPATSFVFYLGASAVYKDADLGSYQGTLEMYNNMHGYLWDGSSVIDPNTGSPVTFSLSGDPVNGEGWFEGDGWPGGPGYGDRRYLISSGPFNMAPGDTQEIGIAIFMAKGSDNRHSISALRANVPVLQHYYNNELVKELKYSVPSPLTDYYLSQNYPNPFNSTTNINYTLPQKSVVTIKIYDILGREVKTINQGEQVAWHYKVSFNAASLASGIYLYRIEAVPVGGQSGNFVQTKKMVLLK